MSASLLGDSVAPSLSGMDDPAVIEMAQELATNETVTELDLFGQSVGSEGAVALARALVTNTTLTALDCANNDIGVAGANALLHVLSTKKNVTLCILDLSGNREDVDASILARLADSLEENRMFHEDDVVLESPRLTEAASPPQQRPPGCGSNAAVSEESGEGDSVSAAIG